MIIFRQIEGVCFLTMTEVIDYAETRKEPPVGVMALWGNGLSQPLPILSEGFFNDALKMTDELLDGFDSAQFRYVNSKLLNCIGLWFLAMESGISTVFKILSLSHEVNGYKKLPEKFSGMPKIVGSNIFPSSLQVSELQEFCCFRNATFHDLYYERKDTQYTKTLFSKIPAYANEIDMIEAARISINSLNFYRYAIQGVSLIENSRDIIKVYHEKLLPRFHEIMERKKYSHISFRSIDTEISHPLTPHIYSGVIKY
jgi:hypothetical protein